VEPGRGDVQLIGAAMKDELFARQAEGEDLKTNQSGKPYDW